MLSRLPRSDNRLSVTPRKHGQRQKPQLFSPCRQARFKDSDPWRFACFRGGADRALSPRGSRENTAPAKEHATLPLREEPITALFHGLICAVISARMTPESQPIIEAPNKIGDKKC